MVRILIKILAGILIFLVILAVSTITFIDRTPYREMGFYREMDRRLDSLARVVDTDTSEASLQIGWASRSITPESPKPLAGYGARDPKLYESVHDSSFIRVVVFRQGMEQAAFITGDLLIFHPEVTARIVQLLPQGWSPDQLYLTTTHTHSGLGGWGPGLVGTMITGEYDPRIVDFIAVATVQALVAAQESARPGTVRFAELSVNDLVYNRLVGEKGDIDPWLKVLLLSKGDTNGILSFYSAHATCLGHTFRQLSGDFPGELNRLLEADTAYAFSAYGAGAVASMGPKAAAEGWQKAENLAHGLKSQLDLLSLIGAPSQEVSLIRSFRLPLPLRDPAVKVSEDLALRPYIFREVFGDYPAHISVLQLGHTVLVGMPCDFSGELALPLYEEAKRAGINLIITSFNGAYIGYVTKDAWYDLNKYEARAMSWFGPDNGAYLSEVVSRLIKILS